MTAIPALYTSQEAAARTGGKLSKSFFKRVAAARVVEATYAGGKLLWTDAQIAAAIAYHARGGSLTSQPAARPSPSTRTSRQKPKPQEITVAAGVTPLRSKPGRRYAS
ncbi:hypothetical protein ACFYY8_33820 [Streptosporangium sp. NPDC001559]|uniref:hypothetical protein n=1 Tax=Streptosporangium sp. NPDC001559 TaxID=3366187 RepID=UPI0036E74F68